LPVTTPLAFTAQAGDVVDHVGEEAGNGTRSSVTLTVDVNCTDEPTEILETGAVTVTMATPLGISLIVPTGWFSH